MLHRTLLSTNHFKWQINVSITGNQMVSLKTYYENVDVELDGTALSNIVKEKLDKVIEELPDEEQFGMRGEIYIGQQAWIQNILVEKSIELHTGDPTTVSARDGNIIIDIREDLEESGYVITFVVDFLNEASSDHMMGLIISKLAEWSCFWREIMNIPDLDNLGLKEKRAEIRNRSPPSRFPLGNMAREEYERSVIDAEVKRLGFEDKLIAYQLRL